MAANNPTDPFPEMDLPPLPNEIVFKILLMIPIVYLNMRKHPQATLINCASSARKISQLSSGCRDYFLKTPELWAQNIEWCHPNQQWFIITLERSQPLPLDVTFKLQRGYWRGNPTLPPEMKRNFNIAQKLFSTRIRTLDMYVMGGWRDLEIQLDLPLNTLEALSFACPKSSAETTVPFRGLILDTALFPSLDKAPALPRLRSLKLTGSLVPYPNPVYQHLQTLAVFDIRHQLSVPEWLQKLSYLTQLSNLTIKGSVKQLKDSVGEIEKIRLPKLESLSLAGKVGQPGIGMETFLTHILTRRGCSLYLSGRLNLEGSEYSSITNGLTVWLGRWRVDDYRSTAMHVSLDFDRIIFHNQWGEKPWPGLNFRISFGWPTEYFHKMDNDDLLCDIISDLATETIPILQQSFNVTRQLNIWTSRGQSVIPWTDFLGRFPAVTTLTLKERRIIKSSSGPGKEQLTTKSILSALDTSRVSGNASELEPTGGVIVPNLRKVIITGRKEGVSELDYSKAM
ncbi:hypothetical protein D9613_007282 [Agrocybe pediades]|uniref:F-box domain-containing protein n=1 Tax=Agrocybe pediades TaxID=84607 RepID=A0A8H4QHJ5_9AGAR|nr:hypothetical protein D9613_007282 [Agrocybe pediades]